MSVPSLAMTRMLIESCDYLFLSSINQRRGYGWHVSYMLMRVLFRYVLSILVGIIFDVSR